MRPTIERTWELLESTLKQINNEIAGVAIESDSYKRFNDCFRKMYSDIKQKYMESSTKNLDRHKVAGIIIVSILESNAIIYKGDIDSGKEFFGQYLVAASVGITYMQNELNAILSEKGKKAIAKLWFPDPLACDTPYFEIFCRNLYFAESNTNWGLNPLDIAEKLFLLEYVTLEKNGINPHILK